MADVLLPLFVDGSKLAIPRASATQNGYLSREDFILFSGGVAVPVTSFNTRTGEVVLLEDDVLAALGYTPLDKHGDTMTGPLTLAGPPSNALHAATKAYVDLSGGGPTALPGTYSVTDYGASGSKLTFIGTITNGSSTLTLTSGTHDFQIGQGITIVGAGSLPAVGGNLLVTRITAIAGAVITIANPATSSVSGAVVKHDDTVALQAAINACATAKGGSVVWTIGYYRVNGPFTDFNSILKIPNNPYNSPTIAMGLKGEAPTGWLTYSGGITLEGSVIIHSDRIGSAANSIISGGPYADGSADFHIMNNTCLFMERLVWRTYENPQISAVDLSACGNYTVLRDVSVDAGVPLLGFGGTSSLSTAVQPTHGTFGIHLPGNSTSILTQLTNVAVNSYGVGIVATECTQFNQTIIMQCNVGLRLAPGYHLLTGRFLIWHCPTVIDFMGGTIPHVIDFMIDVEESSGPGVGDPAWTVPAPNSAFNDPGDLAVGSLSYLSVQGNTGVLQNVGFNGMSRVTQTNLGGGSRFTTGTINVPTLTTTNLNAATAQAQTQTIATLLKLFDGSTISDVSFGIADSGGSAYRLMRVPNVGGTERAKLWNLGTGVEAPFTGGNASLDTGLVSYWNCNEASGTMLDLKGLYNLGSASNPTSAAGKLGGARAFDGTQWAGNGSASGLSPGNTNFTLACWVYLTNNSTDQYIVSKSGGGGADEYIVGLAATTGQLRFTMRSTDASGYTTVPATSFGAAPLNTWLLVVCSYNATTGQVNIQVNNGVVDSAACTPTGTGGAFYAGSYSGTIFFTGRLDAIGYWSRLLT